MKIIDLNKEELKTYKTAIALGNFDGIHIGHQHLLKDNVKKAKNRNLKSSVLLFKNHTKTLLDKNKDLKMNILTSYDEKLDILKDMGIEIIYTIDFDERIMKLSAEKFVKDILIKKLNAKLITVGFDYKFGYKASSDSKYLKKLGIIEGFDVNIIDPIYINDEIISSTLIRNLIKSGNINKANTFLKRDYTVLGTVVCGNNRGNKLGFPTANIKLIDNYTVPKTGVYKTIIILNNKEYMSLTNIGYNPTFDGNKLKIENHILDFNQNIYGQLIKVKFIEFIRDDIKFNTAQELINQIKKDIKYVKKH